MDKKYRKLKKLEHKNALQIVRKTKDKELYNAFKSGFVLLEKIYKQQEKEEKKLRKELKIFADYLNNKWIAYDKDQTIDTNVVFNEGDYPIKIGKDNFFVGLNNDVWNLLKSDQKMYCLQLFIDNVCDEFKVNRLKVNAVVPDDVSDEKSDCFISDNKFNFDCRMFTNNSSTYSIINEIIDLIMNKKKMQDQTIIKESGKKIEDMSIYELETIFDLENDEIAAIMPRFQNENNHILNILNNLDRMGLLIQNYIDTNLTSLINQYEYLISDEYYNVVLDTFNLKNLKPKELDLYLKQYVLNKYCKNENKDNCSMVELTDNSNEIIK